jgi:hypothetical protein
VFQHIRCRLEAAFAQQRLPSPVDKFAPLGSHFVFDRRGAIPRQGDGHKMRLDFRAGLSDNVDNLSSLHALAVQLPPREARQRLGRPDEPLDLRSGAFPTGQRVPTVGIAAAGLLQFRPVVAAVELSSQYSIKLTHDARLAGARRALKYHGTREINVAISHRPYACREQLHNGAVALPDELLHRVIPLTWWRMTT